MVCTTAAAGGHNGICRTMAGLDVFRYDDQSFQSKQMYCTGVLNTEVYKDAV